MVPERQCVVRCYSRQCLLPVFTHKLCVPASPASQSVCLHPSYFDSSDRFTKETQCLASGLHAAEVGNQTADLPVTRPSLQLSATFIAAAIMQIIWFHIRSLLQRAAIVRPRHVSREKPSGLFTCPPCCLAPSCSWHPVPFHLFQVCVVPSCNTFVADIHSKAGLWTCTL